jgi:hypothetical protein
MRCSKALFLLLLLVVPNLALANGAFRTVPEVDQAQDKVELPETEVPTAPTSLAAPEGSQSDELTSELQEALLAWGYAVDVEPEPALPVPAPGYVCRLPLRDLKTTNSKP